MKLVSVNFLVLQEVYPGPNNLVVTFVTVTHGSGSTCYNGTNIADVGTSFSNLLIIILSYSY